MKITFLEFEQPIAGLEAKIDELRYVQDDSALDISAEIERLQKKSQALTKDIYAKLTAWQIAQVARHPQRPYTLDYIQNLFTGFEELHGGRAFADDAAIIGGMARFNDQPVMVIGHQKGRDTKDKIYRSSIHGLDEAHASRHQYQAMSDPRGSFAATASPLPRALNTACMLPHLRPASCSLWPFASSAERHSREKLSGSISTRSGQYWWW